VPIPAYAVPARTVLAHAGSHLRRKLFSRERSYPVHRRNMPTPALTSGEGRRLEKGNGYRSTPKLAPHSSLSNTVPLEYFCSWYVLSCGRGVSVGCPLPG
jgi:hypothetical protein